MEADNMEQMQRLGTLQGSQTNKRFWRWLKGNQYLYIDEDDMLAFTILPKKVTHHHM